MEEHDRSSPFAADRAQNSLNNIACWLPPVVMGVYVPECQSFAEEPSECQRHRIRLSIGWSIVSLLLST